MFLFPTLYVHSYEARVTNEKCAPKLAMVSTTKKYHSAAVDLGFNLSPQLKNET